MKNRTLTLYRTLIISITFILLAFFQGCGKKKEEKKFTELPSKEELARAQEEKVFELQVVASRNYRRVVLMKNKLEESGYKTKLAIVAEDDKVFYRLRLDSLFTHSAAIAMGEKVKKLFPSINDYWIVESVSAERGLAEKTKIAKEEELSKARETAQKEKTFELQLVENKDYRVVVQMRDELEKSGYKTKNAIITKDGETFYCLLLEGLYTKSDAIAWGKKIKRQFPSINYQIKNIKEGQILAEQPKIETKEGLVKTPEKIKKKKITMQGEKAFELQLLASKDHSKVVDLNDELKPSGYKTRITSTTKNGEIFYRLRLDGLYTQTDAIVLGEKLKKQFTSVEDYWVAPVKKNQFPIEKQKIERQKKLTKTQPTQEKREFELQLLASRNHDKIVRERNRLKQFGHKTKITSITKNGETFYRLRLVGLYTKLEATALGEKLKKEFDSIKDYWLIRTK